MYYEFFGLSHPPFKITPDTDVFFEGGKRGAVLQALIHAILQGEGIIKVTGEVGSGKTMLCRMLQMRLPPKVETVYIANPSVSPAEIIHAISFELHLTVSRDSGRIEMMHALNSYLLERHAQGRQVVVFVEESQSMPLATLEEIRLLSNLESKQSKLLQIVLFGQPELDVNLSKPQMRQLRERITQSFRLAPLSREQIGEYLSFRLEASGYRGPALFGVRVVRSISRVSAGLTRRVNIIADKTMLSAFAHGSHNISLRHVKEAARDSEFFGSSTQRRGLKRFAHGLVGLILGTAISVAVFSGHTPFQPAAGVRSIASEHSTPASSPAPLLTEVGTTSFPGVEAQPSKAAGHPHRTTDERALPGLLEQRLRATREWVKATEENRYVIQLLISREEQEHLRNALRKIQSHFDMDNILVYRTFSKNRPYLAFLYGSFETLAKAGAEIAMLPPELKANQPYCRTVRGVRADMEFHDS